MDENDQTILTPEENSIEIFMNIDQKISTLCDALQSILERDFTDYDFWLLDEKCLNPIESMQSECTEYNGIIQVKLIIFDELKRIKINDVLQPAKEWIGYVEEAAAKLNQNSRDFVMMLNDLSSEPCRSSSDDDNSATDSTDDKKTMLLWTFLLELLTDKKYKDIIQWCGNGDDGEFRFVKPKEVAKLWGEQKGKPNMDYNKMARSLRYYYDAGIMSKNRDKNFVYRFNNLVEMTGYKSKQISDIVNEIPRQPRPRRNPTKITRMESEHLLHFK